MNGYGYNPQVGGGFGRYAVDPMMAPPQMQYGTPALGRYAQGFDREMDMVKKMKERGMTDDEIKQAGFSPDIGSSWMSSAMGGYGNLLNMRDEARSGIQKDMVSGIESGAKYAGGGIVSGAKYLAKSL